MNLTSNEWREFIEYGIPEGWWTAFGKQMCDDIEAYVKKLPSGARKDFEILDVKEKYGTLRIYTNWYTKEFEAIKKKYEDLSIYTCCVCGAPATKISTGWICPYCDDHAPENSIKMNNYITDSIKEV